MAYHLVHRYGPRDQPQFRNLLTSSMQTTRASMSPSHDNGPRSNLATTDLLATSDRPRTAV